MAIDILLSKEHLEVLQMANKFAENEVKPLASSIDAKEEIPPSLFERIAENGFFGIFIPESLGGAGLDYLSYALIVEEISKACASTGVLISAHSSLASWPILNFGTPEQKQQFLPRLAKGEVGCFMLSEPASGSDAAGLTCYGEKNGDFFTINGVKNWITNGKDAKIGILFFKTQKTPTSKDVQAIIVDMQTPGISVQKCEHKLGIKGSSTAQIVFENVKIPVSNLLAGENSGFKVAMMTLDGGRIGIAAQALGIAKASYEYALKYSLERFAFTKPIFEFQGIQFKLSDMSTKISAAELLIYKASILKDQKKPYTLEAAQAKLFASEAAMWVTTQGIQVLGGNGYSKEYPLERHFRDAKITEIYEGTSEIQRVVIAQNEAKRIRGN